MYGYGGGNPFDRGRRRDPNRIDYRRRPFLSLFRTRTDYSSLQRIGHNEKIIGEVLREGDNRSKVFLVTKFGNKWDESKMYSVDGSPEWAIKAMDNSIERLGGLYPDAWILHRIDKKTPIEESVRAMDAIRKEGKCKYIGLSEVSRRSLYSNLFG